MLLMLDTCALIAYISFVLITENTAHTHDWRINVSLTLYRPVHEISVLSASASSEGSGESAQLRRLARVFAARIHKVWMKMNTETKI